MIQIKKYFYHFDLLSFDPLSFDPLSFDPLSFDPVSFDLLLVNPNFAWLEITFTIPLIIFEAIGKCSHALFKISYHFKTSSRVDFCLNRELIWYNIINRSKGTWKILVLFPISNKKSLLLKLISFFLSEIIA